jgi:DNA-binding transcriptional ArsR family regulator
MSKESFMLVSLNEDKAKKLAQVISNPTCIKILDYLAGKDATESQVAKDLKLPLSTVHYNLQQLVAAKLVVVDEFHYSEKGREVNHYSLANKYIIIAPKDDPSFLANLKKYMPIAIITIGGAVILKTMQLLSANGASSLASGASPMMAKSVAQEVAYDAAADVGVEAGQETLLMAASAPVDQFVASPAIPWWQSPSIDIFILGAFFVLGVLLVIEIAQYLRYKRSK